MFNIIISKVKIIAIFKWLWCLHNSMKQAKIGIWSNEDVYQDLHNLFSDSKLFFAENIQRFTTASLDKVDTLSIIIIHWSSLKNGEVDKILDKKQGRAFLIIYAPQHEGKIDNTSMGKIGKCTNAIVVNMRGRLLNDVFCSIITL